MANRIRSPGTKENPMLRACLPLGLLLACASLAAAQGTSSSSVIKAEAKAEKPGADGKQAVTVTLAIDKGWHAYANPVPDGFPGKPTTIKVESKVKPKELKVDYPKGTEVKDKMIGDYRVYEGTTVIKLTLDRASGDDSPLTLKVEVQACNEKKCLLPATITVRVPQP
jgi:DsbC/DsbD-like thiol-disulfide interchange protein